MVSICCGSGRISQIACFRQLDSSPRRRLICITRAEGTESGGNVKTKRISGIKQYRPPSRDEATLRAEAEAPFRSLRLVLFGFGGVSAALATFLSLPTTIASLLGASNGKSIAESGQDLVINVAALLLCGFFLSRDLKARDAQMARLMREDALGACQIELASGKLLRLAQLRGAARPVIIAGTPSQVSSALAAAEQYKEALSERGVFIVGLPMYKDDDSSPNGASEIPALQKDDLRWRAVPVRLEDWRTWFNDQAAAASKVTAQGLYVGLRKDGRVRASGVGCPPWQQFALSLPKEDGGWGGFLDGMDGRVGE